MGGNANREIETAARLAAFSRYGGRRDQTDMEYFLERINSLVPLSPGTERDLRACLVPVRCPKRRLLVEEGRRAHAAYFIERGLTRSYWLVDGAEVTTSFSTEGGIVFSMDELYYDRPSEEFVETLEACELFRIGLDDLRRLFRTNLELANWGRIIHQDEYRRLHRSHKERLTLPAARRYENFCRQFPGVARRAQLGYIASYLGVTLSTLSRLRGRRQLNLSQDK